MRRSVPRPGQGGGRHPTSTHLAVMDLGVTRVGATATQTILDDFRARKAGLAPAEAVSAAGVGGASETDY